MSEELPEWAIKAARAVYGRLIYGSNYEKIIESHDGLIRVHDAEKIRGAARIIADCRREALL